MRKLIKFVLVAAFILCVGLPALFLFFVMGMAALGIALGIGGAILGLVFGVLKLALMVLLPIALLWWVATRLLPQRTY